MEGGRRKRWAKERQDMENRKKGEGAMMTKRLTESRGEGEERSNNEERENRSKRREWEREQKKERKRGEDRSDGDKG